MSGDSTKQDTDTSLDSAHVETLLRARVKAGNKADTTIRIFERNDFYYLFEKDGELAAKVTYGSVTAMKQMGTKKPVGFCVMNHANFESLLRHILLVRHLRVEIFKFSGAKGVNSAGYVLEVRASPGNVGGIEHILYGEGGEGRISSSNYLLGLKVSPQGGGQEVSVGLAALDTNLKVVSVVDIKDTDQLTNLETVLVQLGPREAVLPESDNVLVKKIRQLVERNRILVTPRPTKEFSPLSDMEVKTTFNTKTKTEILKEEVLSSGALNAVLTYLNTSSEGDTSKYWLEVLKPGDFMRLDHRAITGINLFPDPTAPSNPCIYSILNQTRTPGGARLLQQWLKQPLICPQKINERLDLVEVMVSNTHTRQILFEDHLRKFPDFQRLSGKFGAQKASLQDLYRVWVALGKLEGVVQCLQEVEQGDSFPVLQDNFVKDIQEAQRDFEKFYQMVETTIDLKEVEQGRFMIKPEFDDQLGELKEQLVGVEDKLGQLVKSKCRELGTDSLKLEHSNHQGHYYRLTLKDEGIIRNNKAFTVIEANKSGIKFRDGKLERLAEEFSDISSRYEVQQKSIVQEIVGISAGYSDPLHHLGSVISRLDVVVSLAIAAVSAPTPYCRPKIMTGEQRLINFSQLRHPIVELQDRVAFIPNDVDLRRDSRFHLITGPNMGGKSTYLRSVGCAVVMAQCGSFVPAESAEISVTDSVLVRIGASDCQMEGRSTFMAEMLETSAILSTASPSSLVLIDELGRGTSTYDGFGLAWAVSEHIAKEVGCFTLFTTHYTELTGLAAEVECVTNYHVSALTDNGKLTLLYQLQPGVCNKSFGIDVAKIADFPDEVVEEARRRISKLEGSAALEKYPEEKRRSVTSEGEKVVSECLEKISELSVLTNKEEMVQKFISIRKEVETSNNEFVKGLIANAVKSH